MLQGCVKLNNGWISCSSEVTSKQLVNATPVEKGAHSEINCKITIDYCRVKHVS